MRVDADDFARPCSCGREHHIAVKEILIEAGAVEKLEEEMSEGMLKEYISPLVICDTNTYAATEELMEDIYDMIAAFFSFEIILISSCYLFYIIWGPPHIKGWSEYPVPEHGLNSPCIV